MTFAEIITEFEKHKDTDEYNNYISGLVNTDRVTAFLGTDDGKKLLQPQLDSYFTKGLETWKTNNLQKLIDAKVKELYPDADPKDTEIAKLKKQFADLQAENLRKDLTNKALTIANEKHLPVELVQFFIGADEKATVDNMAVLEKAYADGVAAAVDAKLQGNNYVPPKGAGTEVDGVTAAFMGLNPNIDLGTN